MMKRLLLSAGTAFLLLAGSLRAQTVTLDGITYTIHTDGQTASVSGYEGSPVDIVIPATVAYDGADYPVTSIGSSAFEYCRSLENITLPEGLQTIGEYAFYDCAALESATFPEGLKFISDYAFNNCTSLASATFPEGLQTIGDYAFNGCTSLSSVTLLEGLHSIGSNAFRECTALASVTFPEGLQTIGEYAFYDCAALESATFREGLQTIGRGAFYDCATLASATFPEGLKFISDYAFNNCTSLASVTLPEGLQSIGESAFSHCVALAYVTFPEGLQYIGGWAFYDCPLADVYCHAAVPPSIETDTFDERTYAEAMLHMPSDALGDYQVAEGWKLFQHILGDLPSTAIGSVAADAPIARYADGIVTTSAPAAITVYAQSGAQVRHAAHCTSLSLAGLPGGIYIIGIEQGGQRQVLKVAR